jgi:hypothetical protein
LAAKLGDDHSRNLFCINGHCNASGLITGAASIVAVTFH